jgi:hypothetical protein
MPSTHMQLGSDLSSAKWYLHITELPLNRFIDVVVDQNYAALIITGFPPIEALMASWLQIQSEYADAVEHQEHKLYVSLFKEIALLTVNLQTINYTVEMLEHGYYPELVPILNKQLSTSFQLDPNDQVRYAATLKNWIMRSKALKINLDMKQLQLEAMQGKPTEPGRKPTREYYQSVLITLSNHVKYPVQDNITVYEFCDRLKRYNRECEEHSKPIKQGAKHGR